MSVWIEIEPEVSLLLTDKNEQEVKALLYSKFSGDKELILKDMKGKELDRLRLNELFNER